MRILLPVIISLTLFLHTFAKAGESSAAIPDSVRIERLAGLCELWGVVKYFHPYLAYKNIDWDESLIKTIPRVNKAETAKDYKRAIQYLLSFLKDPNTYVHDESYVFPRSKISDLPDQDRYPSIVWTEDNIAIMVANDFMQLFQDRWLSLNRRLNPEQGETRGVIVDVRCLTPPEMDNDESIRSRLNRLFLSWLPSLIEKKLMIPSARSLAYTSDMKSRQPAPGFVYRHGKELGQASKTTNSLPVVFILNEGSADLLPLLGGVQEIGQGAIIYEGPFDREGGIDTYEVCLPDNVVAEVRLTEIVKRDGTESVHPDLVIPFTTDTTLLDCPPIQMAIDIIRGNREVPPVIGNFLAPVVPRRHDTKFSNMAYQRMEYRLPSLFRFWNRIRYFYPYRDEVGESWDLALIELIPVFEAAKTKREYVLATRMLTSRLHDSHAGIHDAGLYPYFEYYPAFFADFIEGETVVIHIEDNEHHAEFYNPPVDLEAGDVILTVDGEDIALRKKRLEEYFSASTPQAMQSNVHSVLFGSTNPSPITLTVRKEDGSIKSIKAERFWRTWLSAPPLHPTLQGLGENIKYIKPDMVSNSDWRNSLDDIVNCRTLVLDLRRKMFQNNSWQLMPFFARHETTAWLTRKIERYSPVPGRFSFAYDQEKTKPDEKYQFRGKVVALIDKTTTGIAERMCLYLDAATDVTFVGLPTNGSPGFPVSMNLPGESRPGMKVFYTGVDILHPDGRPVHGVGIQPDILVEPTIEGIHQGRDEILEAALEYLTKVLDN